MPSSITIAAAPEAFSPCKKVAASWKIAAPEPTPALCPCAPDQLVKLKAEYQDALREVTMAGNSVQAYAAERNISCNLAYVRLHRARHSLRERLVAVCGSCAVSGSLRVHLLK